MKRNFSILLILAIGFQLAVAGNVHPTKNIIVMIPDGTSLSVLSASRWLKNYRQEGSRLHIDPYLCGTVTTFCSNSPIGDSAPTTSCYMTGIAEQAGNIAIYPEADPKNDLLKLNPDSAYQPLATLLEAMKIEQKKAAGLVVTCEFPHATPADCSAHTYDRNNYKVIAPQMAYNNLDVMMGGGNAFVTETMKQHFQENGTTYLQTNKKDLMQFSGSKLWALFAAKDMPYDIDRDSTTTPSLTEMTTKAIDILKKNKNGFFLMVEGSKVDWAAHANDPVALLSEFLAFDKAVGAVMDFARKDGNTTVIILPDHGNSGFSIGRADLKHYAESSIDELFGVVSRIHLSAGAIAQKLQAVPHEELKKTFFNLTGIELSDEEEQTFIHAKTAQNVNYTEAGKSVNLYTLIIQAITRRTYFGFTTTGHTGEEVFLAAYHPLGDIPTGNQLNKDINSYLVKAAGLKKSLPTLTSEIYVRHTEVFKGMEVHLEKNGEQTQLIVKNAGNTLIVPAQSSVVTLNAKSIDLGSVAVYVDKTDLFYLPSKLRGLLLK